MSADVLLVGAGDLGAAVGLRLASLGHAVLALRRNASLVPAPLVGRSVDLTREAPDLAGVRPALRRGRADRAAADRGGLPGDVRRRDGAGARRPRGRRPSGPCWSRRRPCMPSSEQPPLEDETTPAAPSDGPGRMLRRRRGGVPRADPARHGAPPLRAVRRLEHAAARPGPRREGSTDPHRWTNRIHREDAAAAVVHLLTMDADPDGLYLGTDDAPAQLGDVAAYLAERLGAPAPPPPTRSRGTASGCPTRGSARPAGRRRGRAIARATPSLDRR